MVGGGYRPLSVVAGYLSAENLRYLAEEEGIHVCQGNIWSQYAIDNGDGDGSISYPYYPSQEHFLKPAQAKDDFIDCINLDGWTMDFLSARYPGGRTVDGEWCGSRQGVGPIETVIRLGTERGTKEMLAVTSAHFDKGFELNDFAWITCTWELGLVEARKIYGYKGRNGMEGMEIWFNEMRRRWPDAQCITLGEFGMLCREQFKNNNDVNYRFVQRGSGVCGSEPELEIQWEVFSFFMCNTGQNLVCPSPNSNGLVIDHLSRIATERHFDSILARLATISTADNHMKILMLDSYEVWEMRDWSPEFISEFRLRYEYDPIPFLPLLLDYEASDSVIAERFRGDYSRLVSDMMIENHFGQSVDIANESGIQMLTEAGHGGSPRQNRMKNLHRYFYYKNKQILGNRYLNRQKEKYFQNISDLVFSNAFG